MSECPHCGALDVQIPMRAWNNADTYQKTVVTVTECCGYAVDLTPIRSWRVSAHVSDREEDDWCERIKLRKLHDKEAWVDWRMPIVVEATGWQGELPARFVRELDGYHMVVIEAEHKISLNSKIFPKTTQWNFQADGQRPTCGEIRIVNKRPTA